MALNKLKKWIGTQAMTAFFDQLNDNVDATNAAIDAVESVASQKHITESGSNTYGSYIKFDDGTMICSGTVDVDLSIWTFSAGRKQYPQPFVGGVAISYARYITTVGSPDAMKALGSLVPSSSETEVIFGVGEPVSGQTIFIVQYVAIGSWK